MRSGNRKNNQLREIKITPDFCTNPLSSVLIEAGNTKVLCSTTLEESVPRWMKGSGKGWVTSEYAMLPASTNDRITRESIRGKVGGRTHEIQRLIGRSFRSVIDLEKLGERALWVDCDVLQADGGTRTASITGGFASIMLAMERLIEAGVLDQNPIKEPLAAVSLGIVDGELMLDMDYNEDSSAEVDMNVVMTESGKLVEIQGTAEGAPFSRKECMDMINLAESGIEQLIELQKKLLTQ